MHYARRDMVALRTDVRWGDVQTVDYLADPVVNLLGTRQLVNVLAEHAQSWAWTIGVSGLDVATDTLIGMIVRIEQGAGSTLIQRRILRSPPAMLNALDGYAEETGIAIGNALAMSVLVAVVTVPAGTARQLSIAAQVAPITLAPGAVPGGLV